MWSWTLDSQFPCLFLKVIAICRPLMVVQSPAPSPFTILSLLTKERQSTLRHCPRLKKTSRSQNSWITWEGISWKQSKVSKVENMKEVTLISSQWHTQGSLQAFIFCYLCACSLHFRMRIQKWKWNGCQRNVSEWNWGKKMKKTTPCWNDLAVWVENEEQFCRWST